MFFPISRERIIFSESGFLRCIRSDQGYKTRKFQDDQLMGAKMAVENVIAIY